MLQGGLGRAEVRDDVHQRVDATSLSSAVHPASDEHRAGRRRRHTAADVNRRRAHLRHAPQPRCLAGSDGEPAVWFRRHQARIYGMFWLKQHPGN